LNDSNHKKSTFMQQVAIELALANVEVHTGRAEDWRPVQRFDGSISRAFAELADFIAACRHLVKPGGFFAAMKGLYPHEEIAKVPADVRCAAAVKLSVPLVDGERHLVLCSAGA